LFEGPLYVSVFDQYDGPGCHGKKQQQQQHKLDHQSGTTDHVNQINFG
jgi:hypothetical protein